MNDPLLNFIDENKERLDTYVPNSKNWNSIQSRLKKNQSRKKIYRFALAIAAVLVVSILIKNTFNWGGENDEVSNDVVAIETNPDFKFFDDKNQTNSNSQKNINWQSDKTVFYEGRVKENPNFLSDKNVMMVGLNTNLTFSMADVNNGATYSWTTAGCVSNSTVIVPTNNSTYPSTNNMTQIFYNENGQEEYYYGVDYYYEQYDEFEENEFETPLDKPLSTFGIDVDGASYSNVRRFINGNYLPPKDAVKLEEMINYFDYDLPEPTGDDPFSITTEVGECPWEKNNQLVQIALKGKSIDFSESQPTNLVFLIDVSGSMNEPDKLPLLKSSLKLLVHEMKEKDRIAIVVYAGSSGLVLPSTSGKNKSEIYEAIENLSAGGSTAGGEGIELAYKVAQSQFLKEGNNRIILATDGDFNVGISDDNSLIELIKKKRETGIFLSVLGFGTGNLQSSKMEKLADNGNGNYFYIDNILEAKKVLVNEIGGTILTIAKDVKLQVEFNPEYVKSYRLLGYENRILEARDFDDDTKDAGDLGSGHEVIALYEIVPKESETPQVASGLRYQTKIINTSKGMTEELAIVKFRYKNPNSSKSKLIERIVKHDGHQINSRNFNFASAVAEFGLLIRESKYRGSASFKNILNRARENKGDDKFGYRAEFIQLVEKAQLIMYHYYTSENYKNR